MKKIGFYITIVLFLQLPCLASANTSVSVKVGVFENKPIVFKAGNDVSGLSVDVLERVAESEGWELIYIHDSFKNNLKRLKNNEIDLIVGLAFTESRNKDFHYTRETLLNNWGLVFQNDKNNITSMQDLIGKNVVLVENNIHSKYFDSLMRRFGFNYRPVFVQSPEELFDKLNNGEAVAGIINRLSSLKVEKQTGLVPTSIIFNPVEVRYASSRKGDDVLVKTIDTYLGQWKQDKNSFYYKSLNKWLNERPADSALWLSFFLIIITLSSVVTVYILYIKRIGRKKSKELDFVEKERNLILESLVDGAVVIDQNGLVISFNKAAEKMFGYQREEVTGNNVNMLMPEPDATRHDDYLKKYLDEKGSRIVGLGREVLALRKNGETFPMRLSVAELPLLDSNNVRFLGMCVDMTIQRKQDKYLQRSQKMDALGNLTGGIAHDYNNMLGVILGYADLLKEKLDDDSRLSMYAEQILRAADRGVSLTKKLLTFARHNEAEREDVDLIKLLRDESLMLEKTLTPRIYLELELSDDTRHIYVDKSELIESIVNMTINAMHAMPEGGRFTIKTENVNFDESNFQFEKNKNGAYVHLSLMDTGIGMTEAQQSRIFEPFYSTKGDGGTGLGMSQVYGFVNDHGGAIDVHSRIGLGTCIDIFIPVSDATDSTQHEAEKNKMSGSDKVTVLVVDDEQSLLDLVTEVMSGLGYKVIAANSGKEALEVLINEPVDLLLTDIIMPDMDGYALVKNVLIDFPDIKVQLMSGYSNVQGRDDLPDELLTTLLHKPFSVAELSEALHQKLQ